jgi:hypothetical protein
MSTRRNRNKRQQIGRANFRSARPERSAVSYFSDLGLLSAEFAGGADEIEKPALIMVEGFHTDSKKRDHEFSAARIKEIAENTNEFMRSGGRIPWQQDHAKTQQANIGDLAGEVELKRISPSDLPDPNATHLVGRLGLFGTLVGRGTQVVADIVAKKIRTISPGIDLAKNIIREVSATPTPAIVGLSTFKRHDAYFQAPTSWDEAERMEEDLDELRFEYDDLCERFWQITVGAIEQADNEGISPREALDAAIAGFTERLSDLLMDEAEDSESVPRSEVTTPFGQQARREFRGSERLATFGRGLPRHAMRAIEKARLGKFASSQSSGSSRRRSGASRRGRGLA